MIDDYFVIEVPDGVTVVALTDENELVLVRQYKHGLGDVVLELPAGVVEGDEEPSAAARRELAEETGYVASSLEHVITVVSKPARMSAKTLVYLARNARRGSVRKQNDAERIETVLVPLDELSALVASGSVVTETSLAALLVVWDRLQAMGNRGTTPAAIDEHRSRDRRER